MMACSREGGNVVHGRHGAGRAGWLGSFPSLALLARASASALQSDSSC